MRKTLCELLICRYRRVCVVPTSGVRHGSAVRACEGYQLAAAGVHCWRSRSRGERGGEVVGCVSLRRSCRYGVLLARCSLSLIGRVLDSSVLSPPFSRPFSGSLCCVCPALNGSLVAVDRSCVPKQTVKGQIVKVQIGSFSGRKAKLLTYTRCNYEKYLCEKIVRASD